MRLNEWMDIKDKICIMSDGYPSVISILVMCDEGILSMLDKMEIYGKQILDMYHNIEMFQLEVTRKYIHQYRNKQQLKPIEFRPDSEYRGYCDPGQLTD